MPYFVFNPGRQEIAGIAPGTGRYVETLTPPLRRAQIHQTLAISYVTALKGHKTAVPVAVDTLPVIEASIEVEEIVPAPKKTRRKPVETDEA